MTHDATAFLPETRTLAALREAAAGCRACELYRCATQTVFGEGPEDARMMLVGETPGDREDLAGRPFVGPAGRELDRALETVGIDRATVYVSNAVKHFRFQERGKRRIHQKPDAGQIRACRPWLRAEIDVIGPEAIVLMGATAAKSLLGSRFSVMAEHGRPLETDLAPVAVATIHPSAILRGDEEARRELRAMFTEDLRAAAEALATRTS
jgi:uracil-DNA glycosylase family protein